MEVFHCHPVYQASADLVDCPIWLFWYLVGTLRYTRTDDNRMRVTNR